MIPSNTSPANHGGLPRRFFKPGTFRMLMRALLLRCPNCGGRRIFATMFALKRHCPTCGLRLERGEGDYFVGAYFFNLIFVEAILYVSVLGYIGIAWPDINWDLITWVSAIGMLAGCVLCYPFSKVTWLAVDLAIRPLSPEELEWHQESGDIGDRELPHV
jgi:uncharacterized protein (DUF983 family)